MANVVKFRAPYDIDAAEKASDAAAIDFTGDPGLTVQDGRDDADINVILRRFGITGQMPTARTAPEYGDFTGVTDYQSALDAVMAADDAFMSLPAELRKRFDNDPAELLTFLNDDKNRDEARELGLLAPLPAPREPLDVRVIPDPTPAGNGDPGGN